GVDVACLGGTKGGMNTTEAVVFFHKEHAREFEYRVKQAGQLASKMRFAAAQWCGMLEGGAWLRHAAHANAMAQKLAAGLRTAGAKLLGEPEVNGVFVELPPATVAALEGRGWHFYKFIGEHGYRLMCSWATAPAAIDRFAADLRAAM
ncbi:MAG: beta-eliminating lyase-related protein, partial [Opitutus sp.]